MTSLRFLSLITFLRPWKVSAHPILTENGIEYFSTRQSRIRFLSFTVLRSMKRSGNVSGGKEDEVDEIVTISAKAGLQRLPSFQINEYGREWAVKSLQTFHTAGLNCAHDLLLSKHFYIADIPEPCHTFHFGNVQELVEDSRVVWLNLTAVCLGKKFTMTFKNKTWLRNASKAPGLLTGFNVRFADTIADTNKSPLVHQTVLHPASVEFSAVHPYRHGMDTWYTYMMALSDPKRPHYFTAVLKHDLQGKGTRFWRSEGKDLRVEDDGFVVVQVFHPQKLTTDFAVLDAQTMELLATIALKYHVQLGFHDTFTPEVFVQGNAPLNLIKAKI
ncbi:hypothetical protein BGZ98_001500 [Dissophora globulifera]|nr:hypothetical protein BGZ98_001500 [Dissophora globulifera]